MESCNVILRKKQKSLEVELQMGGEVICHKGWGQEGYAAYHRLYYVHGGEGFCEIDEKIHQLKPGHLYLFPVNKHYKLWHNDENPLICTYLHLYLMPLILNDLEEVHVSDGTLLASHLKSLSLLIRGNYEYETLLMHAGVLIDILSESIEYAYVDNELILRSVEQIQKNYQKKLSNEMLAKYFGYNTNYYIKIFTKHMGVSPGIYIAKYRLRMSISLILKGNAIKEVSRMVGYEDSKAFARFFKKHTGVAPSDYKKYYVLSI